MAARLLDAPLPIVAAPMAGGPTTVALSAAAARAGAFPFLAGGYRTPGALAAEIAQLRAAGAPFGVNLFVPSGRDVDRAAFRAYAELIAPEAAAHGVRLDPEPVSDDDRWREKVEMLVAQPVPVVSLTFGLPSADDVAMLRRAGSRVLASVTTPAEAQAARDLGVDGLVVQGPDAGGHSATHDPSRTPDPGGTPALVRRVREAVALPVVAGGGVDGPAAVARILDAGAEAVAVGTLLLRTDEAGTSAPHLAALADPASGRTVLTRAFTGRPARALANRFAERYGEAAPVAYPAVHHLTRALRQAALAAGDREVLHLWAGTGYRAAPSGPVADVVRWLAGEN
ncbi:nitronate monooxygenase [Kineosporia sp. J2-2]|uniref:Propionate 3-nitronate monooxygenase n=1 Tax=Kineosporia corallincola TaxID=2835133 RepID=A0ABS5TMR5_9ACTN|nr:nitronate monooxygenase [Kineosporia corallincola]MBT0771491.1 nitronate monooxygenase [Kineosporia corallincola]